MCAHACVYCAYACHTWCMHMHTCTYIACIRTSMPGTDWAAEGIVPLKLLIFSGDDDAICGLHGTQVLHKSRTHLPDATKAEPHPPVYRHHTTRPITLTLTHGILAALDLQSWPQYQLTLAALEVHGPNLRPWPARRLLYGHAEPANVHAHVHHRPITVHVCMSNQMHMDACVCAARYVRLRRDK